MHQEIQPRNLDKSLTRLESSQMAKVELANLGEATTGRITLEPVGLNLLLRKDIQ